MLSTSRTFGWLKIFLLLSLSFSFYIMIIIAHCLLVIILRWMLSITCIHALIWTKSSFIFIKLFFFCCLIGGSTITDSFHLCRLKLTKFHGTCSRCRIILSFLLVHICWWKKLKKECLASTKKKLSVLTVSLTTVLVKNASSRKSHSTANKTFHHSVYLTLL